MKAEKKCNNVTLDSEKTLERKLFSEVKRLGGHALKFNSCTEIGYPDRLVLMPQGKMYWVELKSERKKPRPIQTIRHNELRQLGYIVEVIDTTEKLNQFIKFIQND